MGSSLARPPRLAYPLSTAARRRVKFIVDNLPTMTMWTRTRRKFSAGPISQGAAPMVMKKSDFKGVLPALTTKLTPAQEVDFAGLAADVGFQIEAGVDAIIVCGSLGEASSLRRDEKLKIAQTAIAAAAGRRPVILTIAEDSTRDAASLAAEAHALGVEGLMVLPAMRYLADDREVMAHYRAVVAASPL